MEKDFQYVKYLLYIEKCLASYAKTFVYTFVSLRKSHAAMLKLCTHILVQSILSTEWLYVFISTLYPFHSSVDYTV